MTLHQQFVQLGKQRNQITYRLLRILPQIYEQEIYKKHGYQDIYQYAGELAGITAGTVKKTLDTEKHLKDKPTLKAAVEKQGIYKVAAVAKIATPENEGLWARKVEDMSKASLIQLAKELRHPEKIVREDLKIALDEEMEFIFLKLKKKFGPKFSNKETLRKLLEHLDGEFFPGKKSHKTKPKQKITRNIPAAKKREALEKTGGRCAHPQCNKPHDLFHHVIRFADSPNHDIIVSLCRAHHDFMHNNLIKNESAPPTDWVVQLTNNPGTRADQLYRKYKK